jgi:hypothetical protein
MEGHFRDVLRNISRVGDQILWSVKGSVNKVVDCPSLTIAVHVQFFRGQANSFEGLNFCLEPAVER